MTGRRKTITFQAAAESLAQADHVAVFHHYRNTGTVLDDYERAERYNALQLGKVRRHLKLPRKGEGAIA